jgi:hypothetical protein
VENPASVSFLQKLHGLPPPSTVPLNCFLSFFHRNPSLPRTQRYLPFPPRRHLPSLPHVASVLAAVAGKQCSRDAPAEWASSTRAARSHGSSAHATRTRSPPHQDSSDAHPSRHAGLARQPPLPTSRTCLTPRPSRRLGLARAHVQHSPAARSPQTRPTFTLFARTCPTPAPMAEPNVGLLNVSTP